MRRFPLWFGGGIVGTGVAAGALVSWMSSGSATPAPIRGSYTGSSLPDARDRDRDDYVPPAVAETTEIVENQSGLRRARTTLRTASSGQRGSVKKAKDNAGDAARDADAAAKAAREAAEMQRAAANASRDVGSTITQQAQGLAQQLAGLTGAEREAKLAEALTPPSELKELYEKAGLKTNRDLADKSEAYSKGLESGANFHEKKASAYEKEAREADQAARELRGQERKLAANEKNLDSFPGGGSPAGAVGAHKLKDELEKQLARELESKATAGGVAALAPHGAGSVGKAGSPSDISQGKADYPNGEKSGTSFTGAIPFAGKVSASKSELAIKAAMSKSGKGEAKGEGELETGIETEAIAGMDGKAHALLNMVKLANAGSQSRAHASANEQGASGHISAESQSGLQGQSAFQGAASLTIFKRVSLAIERCQVKNLDCVH